MTDQYILHHDTTDDQNTSQHVDAIPQNVPQPFLILFTSVQTVDTGFMSKSGKPDGSCTIQTGKQSTLVEHYIPSKYEFLHVLNGQTHRIYILLV